MKNTTKTATFSILAAAMLAVSPMTMAHMGDKWHQDNYVAYPLVHASYHGDVAEVNRLIATGADINAVNNKYGRTALHAAALEGHAGIVKVLIAAGADVNAAKNNGVAALYNAALEGHAEVAKLLIAAGADVNVANYYGNMALNTAAILGHAGIVKILIAAGADVNAKDSGGGTAVLYAAKTGHSKIAQILLECGANPDIRSTEGNNAWDYANEYPLVNVVFRRFYKEAEQGRTYPPCDKLESQESAALGIVATAKPPKGENVAEYVFENTWRSVVVIENGDTQGSGVIIRPNVVATNCHVVDEGGGIVVYKADERKAATDSAFHATIRHMDNARDFCLLDVAGLWGIAAAVRQYNTLKVGEDVYNLGAPKGLDLSLSSGIISQLRKFDGQRWIQTDAAISPGSSGGGMFDSEGNLIGITTQKLVSEDAEGIGFAIPADLVLEL